MPFPRGFFDKPHAQDRIVFGDFFDCGITASKITGRRYGHQSVRHRARRIFGKGGEIATNRIHEQEISVLALHLLQASLVYVNTRMLQTVLVEPKWAGRMTPEDYRGLTPLIYSHVNPYGRFDLDLNDRIDFGRLAA